MAQLQRLIISADQWQAQQIQLTPEQQHYLSRVLRLRSGEQFIAMDGRGQAWLMQLQADRARVVESLSCQSELPIAVTLVLALPKGNGFDEVVRQVTELGVSCIAPVISDRTLLKPSDHKWQRWQRIVQEAAEQSERQMVPTVLEPMSWGMALETLSADRALICMARGAAMPLLDQIAGMPVSLLVAIGPEGGWTDAEVAAAISVGYQPTTLGSRILRAVTAPVMVMSLLAGIYDCASDASIAQSTINTNRVTGMNIQEIP